MGRKMREKSSIAVYLLCACMCVNEKCWLGNDSKIPFIWSTQRWSLPFIIVYRFDGSLISYVPCMMLLCVNSDAEIVNRFQCTIYALRGRRRGLEVSGTFQIAMPSLNEFVWSLFSNLPKIISDSSTIGVWVGVRVHVWLYYRHA